MTIFQLECFCALADSLNFTQTANAMFITQPALSRAISSLEQELQLTLLQRTTHSVTLTPAGKIFSSECHKMLKEFQRGSERARSAQAGQIGSVRIGFQRDNFETYIVDFVNLFRRSHTDITLELLPLSVNELNNALQEKIFAALTAGGCHRFMVGDVKQSIYGFREACPENFLEKRESYAPAETGTFPAKIALNANKVRNNPLRVILNGLGKDAAFIISRINGFTYVKTEFDPYTEEVKVVSETPYSNGPRAAVKCYGADNVPEGVAIMKLENVGVSITGNSTNPTRFQHPVAGTYKKWCVENGVKYFSVASGGGTGRTLHPDNMAAGPSSYGMTDTMGRMHSDAQFAGSSSVPAHVEMMGLIGMGNNPMVGATVAVAVAVEEALKKA